MTRVALFMDYENFYTSLKERSGPNPHGAPPELDFLRLVDYIQREFGELRPDDFIAAANFSHYNAQKGGLNKVATIMDLDSYKPADVRQVEQSSSGKKYVLKNYADMWLAYHIGKHVQKRPADIYLIASGDKDFVAVAHALQKDGHRVIFLVPDPNNLAPELEAQFQCIEVPDILQTPPPADEPPAETPPQPLVDPVQKVLETLGALRRALSAGIPEDLLKALLPPEEAVAWVNKAYGEGLIDRWEAPDYPGVTCVSLRTSRMRGQIVTVSTRPEIVAAAQILYTLVSQVTGIEPSHAAWRHAIHEKLGFSSKKSKRLLQDLYETGLLDKAYPKQLNLALEKVLRFIDRLKA